MISANVESDVNELYVKEHIYSSRIVHLHPTLQCNLECVHCYSSSSPSAKDRLEPESLFNFLEIAYKEGYNTISISGGEPFLYGGLEKVLKFSKNIGFQTLVATNGMLLKSKKNQDILQYIDLIAVSIDGQPVLHNKIRNQFNAFEKMLEGLEVLKKNKKDFGIIHTLTNESWESIFWLGEFAKEHGAKLLQFHPIENYGRAKSNLKAYELGEEVLHKIYILISYMKEKHQSDFFVQLDMLHRDYIKSFPASVQIFPLETRHAVLSDLIQTIIVDEKGHIIPLCYGFSNSYKIGNVNSIDKNTFENYINLKWAELNTFLNQCYQKIITSNDSDFCNWNEFIVSQSNS